MAEILIVDDSRTSRKFLREILERNGHTIVAEAVNGEDGYLKYKEFRPQVVTMDITMPVMNGVESLSLIKKENPEAVVLMITAVGQKDKMIEAVKRGADEFILKPFNEAEIIGALERI
ncbi:MAG: response regulator [Lachnospiraceae bacterium]|nr:response regulator [Lachnospiraceae bacterium]